MAPDLHFVRGALVVRAVDHPDGQPQDALLDRFEHIEIDLRRLLDQRVAHRLCVGLHVGQNGDSQSDAQDFPAREPLIR